VGPAPSDDPAMRAATATNETGDKLLVWARQGDGRYQIFIELHPGVGRAFGTTMPRYRIDGGVEIDTDAIRREGDKLSALWGYVSPSAALWLAWTSFQDEVLTGDPFHQWLAGREAVVTWIGAGDTAYAARFSLDGARAAILEATGVKSADLVN
jgi:hypothetical protein